ncbi:MAG: cyclic nucleotide-binding domain-containing protein [bacterium]
MSGPDILKKEEIPSFEELLSDLSDDDVETLGQFLERAEYVPGETIFYESDPSESLYVIQVGSVEISKMSDQEGEEYVPLVQLDEGNIFGELSFLTDSPRSASAVASTHVVLYKLSKQDFNTIVEDYPDLGCKVYDAILNVLAYRLRRTDKKLVDLSEQLESDAP